MYFSPFSFSPSLIALGVTLLAFGNGAPDVFSAVTAITTGDPEAPDEGLGLGFLMGEFVIFLSHLVTEAGDLDTDAAILIRRSIHLSDSIVGGMPLGLYKVGNSNLPVVVIVLLVSTGLTITIFVTSRWDRAPTPYHRPFFATLGFLTSIVWIYAIAHELVNSLEALGIVWEISEAILGITVMAFASSISDLMSNSLLAHNGYPRIAFAACIGSPLFNLLVGAGISYTIKLARSGDHTAEMSFTLTHVLLFSFLMGVLTTNLVVAFTTGFQMRRAYGICLLCAYAVFMMLAILVEADIIMPPASWHLLTGTE
ncbi:unnamed protein product [Taenia asiatica]|uniref:Sodium/calcium exchanger membrane region domain-containing protein n=1 Tax=Taenia asiatica TaxID=60517 RepID=A0A3P6PH16_TAEAS|nr:unnamed protein product [Taenia asiatica]